MGPGLLASAYLRFFSNFCMCTVCLAMQENLGALYKQILHSLHRQKAEDDREDAARLKALHDIWDVQAEDLENL